MFPRVWATRRGNFQPLVKDEHLRREHTKCTDVYTDTFSWENFLIAERMKHLKNHRASNSSWFWRTHQQQEIDYIEERESGLLAVEIKSQSGRGRIPATFSRAYPGAELHVMASDSWRELVYADL